MSEDETQRGIAKRQIARLIGGAAFPAFVLSEELQIVFANEALGRLVGRDPDALIGLACPRHVDAESRPRTSPSSADVSAKGLDWELALSAWLSPFPNSDPQRISVHRDRLPPFLPPQAGHFEPRNATFAPYHDGPDTAAESQWWVRISLPLEMGESPVTLVLLKPDLGDLDAISYGETASRIKHIALRYGLEFPALNELWFVHGPSPAAAVLRNQLKVACEGQHSLLIEGVSGAPSLLLAHAVHRARKANSPTTPVGPSRPITIDCRLMDRDLLQSVFDWIDDEARQGIAPTIVLHGIELLSQDLRQPLARKQHQGRWCILGTTAINRFQALSVPGNAPAWAQLMALVQTQTLRWSPLSDRVEDMESLVSAWLDHSAVPRSGVKHSTWSREFMDAVQAYSWPGDCEELQQALEHAVRSAAGSTLMESHLPISIRTFPSHKAHAADIEPIVLDEVLENIERDLIAKAIHRFPRNRTAAAKLLGISRARLLRRLQQTGLADTTSERPLEDDAVVFEEFDEHSDE